MERLSRLFGRLSADDVISGIPGSPTDHHGVPYSITEEFVAVYRMHPLLPDELSLRSAEDNRTITEKAFPDMAFQHAQTHAGTSRPDQCAVFVRHPSPGRDHAAQLPEDAAAAGRSPGQPERPRRHRHPAQPRTRRPALQRFPRARAQAAPPALRAALDQSGVGRTDPPRLRQPHRQRRPDDRSVRRAIARRLRIL